jgi:tyrosinase
MNTTRRRLLSLLVGAALAVPAVITSPSFAANPMVRRDVQAMLPNDPFFSDYSDAITAMHTLQQTSPQDQRNWRNQALIHLNHCPHGRIGFFPWHRWYILFYEQICRELIGKPDFTLAYWNWAAKLGMIPDPFYANGPLNVTTWMDPSNAQSNNWGPSEVVTVGTRGLIAGVGVQQLLPNTFDQTSINGFMAQTNFINFWRSIEGQPHNNGHVLVGQPNGHMIDGMSPLDPIFWLHHCNVDRLWAEWQSAGNKTRQINENYDNQFVNGMGQPQTGITAARSFDFKSLGYTYDTLATAEPIASSNLLRNSAAALANLSLTEPEVIGSATNEEASMVGKRTNLKVAGTELLSTLFSRRTFRATSALSVPRNAVEGRRILAQFSDIQTKGGLTGILVNVYVNPPDDPLETTTRSKHFAGAFSFFGFGIGNHTEYGGHAFIVDITRTLRDLADDGLVAGDNVNIQLIPDALNPRFVSSQFTVGKIELIST